MKRTSWSSGLSVTAAGVGVISHAGAIAPRLLADRVGLTTELSGAMARRRFIPIHDRGRVLIDVAVMLADGGESISDIGVLRHQSGALGPVASAPTVWRTLDEVTAGKRKKIQVARARTRRHVWSHLPGGVPASACAGRDLGATIVLDVDATCGSPRIVEGFLCGFRFGDRSGLVGDRADHSDVTMPSVVVVKPVAPVQHSSPSLSSGFELVS